MIAVILPYRPENPLKIVRYIEKTNEITSHPREQKIDPRIKSRNGSFRFGKKMITFGTGDHCDWQAKNIHVPGGFHSDYDVYHNGQFLCHAEICVPGAHNILNSLAAFAAAYESGAKPEDICRGLKDFHGAHRRFELTGTYCGVTFADDYGHHPTELQATLRAAMQMGYKRVWAVHQPFTFSRTSELLDDFARVLQIPDKCVISAIMGSREVNTIGIHAKDLADKIGRAHV